MDVISKQSLYKEVNDFKNLETIIDILSSGATALKSEEAETAHAAKKEAIRQYLANVDIYVSDLEQEELEFDVQQPFHLKAVNAFKNALQTGLSYIFRNRADDDENYDYEDLRHEHFKISFLDNLMDRLEALTNIYETLNDIAYLDSLGQSTPELSKIIMLAEKNNTLPLLRHRIEAGTKILQAIMNVPFDSNPVNKLKDISAEPGDPSSQQLWALTTYIDKTLNPSDAGTKQTPSAQKITFELPEKIKIAFDVMHHELGMFLGKYYYDFEYASDIESDQALSATSFNDRKDVIIGTAQVLFPLADSILLNEIKPVGNYKIPDAPSNRLI